MRPARHRTGVIAAVAVLLLAAACAGGRAGTVYHSNFTAGYDPQSLGAAMSRAPLLVEAFGGPAPEAAGQSLSRSVALALRRHGPSWLPRNYTDSAEDAGRAPYRVRVAYDAPRAFDRQQLCGEAMSTESLAAARPAGEAAGGHVIAGLCRGATMLAVAEGAPATGADPGSEGFDRFMGLLGREALPRRNPVLDDDCIFRRCD
jgi:hypothetical protein